MMNGMDKIIDRLDGDTEVEIAKILQDAQAEAEQITASAQASAAALKAELAARNEKNAAEREERLVSVANMESRKLLLSAKQKLVEEAFARALQKLCTLPEEEMIETLASLMARAAHTGREQVIFSAEDRKKIGKAAVARANELLAQAVTPKLGIPDTKAGNLLSRVVAGVSALTAGTGMLTLSDETRPMKGGFLLKDGAVEVNCTFETLLRLRRNEMAGEVAKILFPQ